MLTGKTVRTHIPWAQLFPQSRRRCSRLLHANTMEGGTCDIFSTGVRTIAIICEAAATICDTAESMSVSRRTDSASVCGSNGVARLGNARFLDARRVSMLFTELSRRSASVLSWDFVAMTVNNRVSLGLRI
ncbi:unnamed protein product, partial [Mycena citricolor]